MIDRFDRPWVWMLVLALGCAFVGFAVGFHDQGFAFALQMALGGLIAGSLAGTIIGGVVWGFIRLFLGSLDRQIRHPERWGIPFACLQCGWYVSPEGPWSLRNCLAPPCDCPECAGPLLLLLPRCGQCGEPLNAGWRIPSSFRSALWGGSMCGHCRAENDKWGRGLSPNGEPVSNSKGESGANGDSGDSTSMSPEIIRLWPLIQLGEASRADARSVLKKQGIPMDWWNRLLGRRDRGRRVQVHEMVWMNEAALQRGFLEEISERFKHGDHVLAVAHFANELEFIVETLRRARCEYEIAPAPLTYREFDRLLKDQPDVVHVVPASLLPEEGDEAADSTEETAGPQTSLLAVHHHPWHTEDQYLIQAAGNLQIPHVSFLTSLDHPLFRRFAGQTIVSLLKTLGAEEDECLDSMILNRQVQRAQARIARKVAHPEECSSAEEWLDRNWESTAES